MHRIHLLLPLLTALAAGAAELPMRPEAWTGWNEELPVEIRALDHGELEFRTSGGTWNTPLHQLDVPCRVTAWTMLEFKVFTPAGGNWELNLFPVEGGEFSLLFPTRSGEWTTVRKYLFKAAFKRGNLPENATGALMGMTLQRIQLAVGGGNSPIRIAGVKLFEGSGNEPELPADDTEATVKQWAALHPPRDYRELQRNGVFPFGVVTRADANVAGSELFGYALSDSLDADLRDMKRHYLNTYSNFCDGTDPEARIGRSELFGLRLLETAFNATRLAELPPEAPEWRLFDRFRRSPALLAWYGPDEPTTSAIPGYLADKQAAAARDPEHPYTSAFHLGVVRQLLGPAMEVMIPDCYSLFPGQDPADPAPLLSHYRLARQIREQTAKKRIWFMTQTFSNRHGEKFSARYPTPEEIRLDMYATLAGGANGILFFIYNDLPTYLDESVRGEEFDYTLIDPWGNGNAVYDEIAAFGRDVVPVMPSFLDAEPSDAIAVQADARLLVGQSANAMGTLLIPVNKSLTEAYNGTLELSLPAGTGLFDLVTLEPSAGVLALPPGGGAVLAVAAPEQFRQLTAEITGRRQQQQSELAELRCRELAAAGFSGVASPEWLRIEQQLREIQADFGAIHRQLIVPEVIVRADGGAEFAPLHDRLKELSRRYFAFRADLAAGKIAADADLEQLRQELRQLNVEYQQQR